jgi:DNA-binding MarR family transcriptional regulator
MALDAEMAGAGFTDRRFPDGRVLRLCSGPDELTISGVARSIGVSRQAASKLVAGLLDRGYVTIAASAEDGREKIVTLTARANEYLAAQRAASRRIEERVRADLGDDVFGAVEQLVAALSPGHDVRMRDYIRTHTRDRGLPF